MKKPIKYNGTFCVTTNKGRILGYSQDPVQAEDLYYRGRSRIIWRYDWTGYTIWRSPDFR